MIKEFIERIGQVIRKMLGREKIKDAIGVEVAVSDKMANGIDLWAKMYKNEPPWKEKNIKLCGLLRYCRRVRRLVTAGTENRSYRE